jgi:hypothetical protein
MLDSIGSKEVTVQAQVQSYISFSLAKVNTPKTYRCVVANDEIEKTIHLTTEEAAAVMAIFIDDNSSQKLYDIVQKSEASTLPQEVSLVP